MNLMFADFYAFRCKVNTRRKRYVYILCFIIISENFHHLMNRLIPKTRNLHKSDIQQFCLIHNFNDDTKLWSITGNIQILEIYCKWFDWGPKRNIMLTWLSRAYCFMTNDMILNQIFNFVRVIIHKDFLFTVRSVHHHHHHQKLQFLLMPIWQQTIRLKSQVRLVGPLKTIRRLI